ncbi:MAG: hypothetical protein ACD_50C00343G0007 [uncultured bacterium]|nr:MAG: hypothetical protein ACD_50C00343G0007 [uncultured bacterium]OGH13263.1 MAG: glucose-6-phosphate dehydrogenase [Candidatus Levybacteria bacterium RIFCSPHIGHO2_01_FULL_38_26]
MNAPFVIVIFGATGDLAQSKLISSLFSLFRKNQLGKEFYIIGFARRKFTDDEFRTLAYENIKQHGSSLNHWEEFAKNIYYQPGLFDEVQGYEELIKRLNAFDKKMGACITRLFYLATPPNNYSTILDFLRKTKLSEGCGQGSSKWTRLVIEKPFGKDLETAKSLDEKLSKIFEEKQIFRVDHYLGKETVQNMVVFRFANGIFEPVWNKNYIDHVQITFGESKGIGGRGAFFDGVGMLRDVGQNHLMQLLTAVVMEQPKSFSKEGVRDARAAAIKALRYIDPEEVSKSVVRGQYQGYKKEKNVNPNSETETFVAMKTFFDNDRFRDVPFYIRAGKKMPKDTVEISIVFIQTCHLLFREFGCPEEGNILKIRIQPDEGIGIRVIAKAPGSRLSLKTVDMEFTYKEEFREVVSDAYEKILLDIFAGDQMLFNRSDELSYSWEFITRILQGWDLQSRLPNFKIPIYSENTSGPKEANELFEKDGRKWLE